eukprot:scaffold24646_cov129-Isochrysis_galbana.AAC.12
MPHVLPLRGLGASYTCGAWGLLREATGAWPGCRGPGWVRLDSGNVCVCYRGLKLAVASAARAIAARAPRRRFAAPSASVPQLELRRGARAACACAAAAACDGRWLMGGGVT